MAVEITKRLNQSASKWQLWLYKHAPKWILAEGNVHRTAGRMVLVTLSFAPLFGLLALVIAAITY